LFILGGWNASQQFDDLFIMETKLNPPVWSCVERCLCMAVLREH
jgi:hypothetical protein